MKKITKKEMKSRCQALLKNLGTISSKDDHDFLVSVFEGHPDFSKRTRGQAFIFQVRRNNTLGFPSNGFWIIREDGTASDISYIKALQSSSRCSEKNKRDDVLKALRSAIMPDIAIFRQTVRWGVDLCPFTGEVLTIGNCHIDHYNKPFVEVAEGFISKFGIYYLFERLNPSDDGETATYFTDQKLIKTFREYHNANTHLRAVSKIANLQIIPNEYRNK